MFIDENVFFLLIMSNVILLLCVFMVYCGCKYSEAKKHKQRLDLITNYNDEFQKKLENKLNGFYKESNKDFNNVVNIYLVFNTSTLTYILTELGFCEDNRIKQVYKKLELSLDESLRKNKQL